MSLPFLLLEQGMQAEPAMINGRRRSHCPAAIETPPRHSSWRGEGNEVLFQDFYLTFSTIDRECERYASLRLYSPFGPIGYQPCAPLGLFILHFLHDLLSGGGSTAVLLSWQALPTSPVPIKKWQGHLMSCNTF